MRLRRSIEKITDALPAERFSEADWTALLSGYFSVPLRAADAPRLAVEVPLRDAGGPLRAADS